MLDARVELTDRRRNGKLPRSLARVGTYFVWDATTMLERSSDRSQKQDGNGQREELR